MKNKKKHLTSACLFAVQTLLLWLVSVPSLSAGIETRLAYVGTTIHLTCPSESNGTVNPDKVEWYSRNIELDVRNLQFGACDVIVKSYFTEKAVVYCDYKYMSRTGVEMSSQTAVAIECYAINLRLNYTYRDDLRPGDGFFLEYTASPDPRHPSGFPSPQVGFESSNYNVATVSSAGYVYAVGQGTAVITATNNAGPNATCTVVVNAVEPTGIDVKPDNPSPVAINGTQQLSYTLYPSGAKSGVTWSSNPSSVAKVSQSGLVTGVSEGTARITATTDNGLSDYVDVQVYKPVPSRIQLRKTSLELLVGTSETLAYDVTPADAIYTVTWASDAEGIAEVSSSGRVTAKASGKAVITVTTDNGKSSSCTVTVPPQPTGIAVSPQQVELIIGRSKQLSYTLYPQGAKARTVTWASDTYNVCSVSQSGLVTAVRPGTATVTATTDNGQSASTTVTVPKPVYQLFAWKKNGEKDGYMFADKPEISLEANAVKLSSGGMTVTIAKADLDKFTLGQVLPEHPTGITMPATLTVGYKRSERLSYTLEPADAQTEVTWLNAAPEVASISNGFVAGLQPGETTLKAQTSNGLRAACLVTVPVPRYRLVVWTYDKKKSSHDFADKPEITIDGETFTVASERTTVSYQATDIWKFTLEDASLLTTGDVNGDSTVDVADIATVISVMAGTMGNGSATSADVNGDGTVDVADIATIISIMAGK